MAQQTLPTFTYCLQVEGLGKKRAVALEKLTESGLDWLVIDYAFYGDAESRWSKQEVAQIRAGKPGRKVIAYLSIGEAGTYRFYWDDAWAEGGKITSKAPSWLMPPNPNWPDNFRVRYWRPEWQKIVMQHLAAIQEAGFDGVWLDTVDTFEFYEHDAENDEWIDHRKNPETGQSYRQDMTALVRKVAAKGRETQPDFLVVPNNGTQLLADPRHVKTVSAQGLEDLFTSGNAAQDRSHTAYVLENLQPARTAGLPILLIEYGNKPKAHQISISGAKQHGLALSLTDRPLKTLGTPYLPD